MMQEDLLKRLKRHGDSDDGCAPYNGDSDLMAETVAEIERLRELLRFSRPYVLAYETEDVGRRNLLANIDSALIGHQQSTNTEQK